MTSRRAQEEPQRATIPPGTEVHKMARIGEAMALSSRKHQKIQRTPRGATDSHDRQQPPNLVTAKGDLQDASTLKAAL
jgi:hypothetical protein